MIVPTYGTGPMRLVPVLYQQQQPTDWRRRLLQDVSLLLGIAVAFRTLSDR